MSYGLVLGVGFTRKQAFTCCYLAGMLIGFLAMVRVASWVLKMVPLCLKVATTVGLGLLTSLVGMVFCQVVSSDPQTLLTLGDWFTEQGGYSLAGVLLFATLLHHQVKGAVVYVMAAVSLAVWAQSGANLPQQLGEVIQMPSNTYFPRPNIAECEFTTTFFVAIGAFTLVGLFEVAGVVRGMARIAHIAPYHGHVPGIVWAFLSAAVGTIVAARLGVTPVLPSVDSAAGCLCSGGRRGGGRTGITAVVAGCLFLASQFFAPILTKAPLAAVAPVLVVVGASMLCDCRFIDWNNMCEAVPAFLCAVMMPFTFSVPVGLISGIGMSIAFYITSGAFLKASACCRPVDAGAQAGSQYGAVQDGGDPFGDGPQGRASGAGNGYPSKHFMRLPNLILRKEQLQEAMHATPSLRHPSIEMSPHASA